MNRTQVFIGLILIICFQFLVLVFEYVGATYPLWTGQEIKLKTVPIDPRSLFRGNYARLNYGISQINSGDVNTLKLPRNGEVVYIKLKKGEDGTSYYDGVSLEQPADGLFIRGRVKNPYLSTSTTTYPVNYGIEAFFAPKEKALALEKDLRSGAVATVMVASNGKATLKDILAK